MRNKHRLKYWLLCLIFAASSVASLTPSPANAAPQGAGVNYFTDRADAYYAARYLRDCMNQYRPYEIALTQNGSLYNGLTQFRGPAAEGEKGVDIGRYYSPINSAHNLYYPPWEGWIRCPASPDSSQALKAINDLGYDTAREFLIDLGYMQEAEVEHRVGTQVLNLTPYTINEYRTVERDLNAIINRADMHRTSADEFFVYDTIFPKVCQFSTTISGRGDKATYINIIDEGSGNYSSQNIDIEFPAPSTGHEADKLITAYDYGGNGPQQAKNITCRNLLVARNALVPKVIQYNEANTTRAIFSSATASTDGNLEEGETACTAGALGWIMCPLAVMFQGIINSAAENIDNIMAMEPLLNTNSGNTIRSVWSLFVGFANLLLVIAFLIVIFSQATSIGLSAYGIKKILPRIIAAAILINLSFYICAIAVDITNIVGGSVKGIVNGIITNIPKDQIPFENWDLGEGAAAWIIVVLGSLAGAMAVVTNFMLILPALFTGALSLFIIFIGLALRQVLVYTLIFIAPLAFAAMILPNTEQLFTKWRKLFVNMLIMYPVVMFMLYGSNLVGGIILMTKGGQESVPIDIIALVVMTVGPFAGLYAYIKGSNKLMSMAAGAITKLGAAPRKAIDGWSRNQQQNLNNRKVAWMDANPPKNKFGRYARSLDPTMMKLRQDEWARQYSEAGSLAGAKYAADMISNSGRATELQKARAADKLNEISMKEAKIRLDYEFSGDPEKAFNAAVKKNDISLMKLAAGKFTDTAQLGTLQTKLLNDNNINDEHVSTIASYLKENHFTKVKDQDLGMMYAMVDPTGLGDKTKAKAELKVLMDGGSRYDIKAMGASDVAIGGQEKYVLDRQTGWNDDPNVKAYTKPAVLDTSRSERILDDPSLKAQVKQGQRDILAAATAPGSIHHIPHP